MRVVGISGSLRDGSYNRRCSPLRRPSCRPASSSREWTGLETLPAYDEDARRPARRSRPSPGSAAHARRCRRRADRDTGVQRLDPGALKNALDWASRPFPDNCLRGKPVAVVGASTGLFGAVWAQADLRRVLKTIGADVVETALPVPAAHEAFTTRGDAPRPPTRERSAVDRRRARPGRASGAQRDPPDASANYPGDAPVGEWQAVNTRNRSFVIEAIRHPCRRGQRGAVRLRHGSEATPCT